MQRCPSSRHRLACQMWRSCRQTEFTHSSGNNETGDIGVHARLSLLSEEDESESLLLLSDEELSLLLESESEELLESESDELLLLAAAAAAACCCMMSFGRFCAAGSHGKR